jgi:tetratricopeptide (TPR) repeat protein
LIARSIAILTRAGAEAETVLPRLNQGNIAAMQGDHDAGEQLYLENLAITRRHGNQWGQSVLIGNLSIIAEHRGDFELANARLHEQLALATAIGDHALASLANLNLGEIAQRQRDFRAASQYSESSLSMARGIGHQYIMASSMNRLGTVARLQGRYTDARRLIEEALALNRKNGNRYYVVVNMLNLGRLSFVEHDIAAARQHFWQALQIASEIKAGKIIVEIIMGIAELLLHDGKLTEAVELLALLAEHPTTHQQDKEDAADMIADLQSEMPETIFADALERGRSTTLDSVVNHLLRNNDSAANTGN